MKVRLLFTAYRRRVERQRPVTHCFHSPSKPSNVRRNGPPQIGGLPKCTNFAGTIFNKELVVSFVFSESVAIGKQMAI